MTVTPLTNNDTYSSPFYDFLTDDALYVGDDTGNLEQFTGVFNGPISGPTTIALGSSPVASPAYDYTSGCVFAGDTEGYLYQVNSGTAPGTICTSGTYGLNATSAILGNGGANEGIFDAPLVDSTAGEVYVFVTDSAAITATGTCAAGDNCVAEFPTSFLSGAAPGYVEPLGAGGVGYNLYTGTFDNVWFNSSNSTGNLYAVGNTATVGGGTLYGVTLTNGLMAGVASAVTGLNSAEYPWPSPATEFCNGACTASSTETTSGTDYLFFSVNRGAPSGCSNGAGNGCILSYNINNPSSVSESGSGLNVTTPGTNGCWASGGLVVDNMAPTTGASQIYFVNLNGADAGGPAGQTSTNCTAGTAATINGVQAAQSNP
jgi:hypothetical protein